MTETYEMKPKGRAARLIALLALSLLLLAGCGFGGPPVMKNPGASTGSAVAVTTVQASLGSVTRTLEIGGEVAAEDSVGAYADIAGKVATVLVEVGTPVRKGQVIARIDPSKPGMEYAESPVSAPISGTVTAVSARVGETISTTTSLATIGRIDTLEIETKVPERFIGRVRVGTPATLSLAAWTGLKFSAHVAGLSPVVDSTSRTLKATLALDRPDGRVKAGMYATVTLVTDRRDRVIAIPVDCLVTRDGSGDVVFVVEGGRAVQRSVTTGLSAGGMVEITGGIKTGEQVVASGQSLLTGGAQVRVVNDGMGESAEPAGNQPAGGGA